MPTITPAAEALLAGLSNSALAWLANVAREQLEADEVSSAIAEEPGEQELAFHQVKLIAEIVEVQISQELALTEALKKSAAELEINTVMVLPPETGVQEGDHLLDPGRTEALSTFADAWRKIVRDLLTHLELRS